MADFFQLANSTTGLDIKEDVYRILRRAGLATCIPDRRHIAPGDPHDFSTRIVEAVDAFHDDGRTAYIRLCVAGYLWYGTPSLWRHRCP